MSRERSCGSGSAPALPLGAAGRGSFLLGGQIVPALDVFVILLQARFELSLGLFEQRRAAVGNVLPLQRVVAQISRGRALPVEEQHERIGDSLIDIPAELVAMAIRPVSCNTSRPNAK